MINGFINFNKVIKLRGDFKNYKKHIYIKNNLYFTKKF